MGFREGNEKPEETQQALKLEEPSDDDETKVRLDDAEEGGDEGGDEGDEDKVPGADKKAGEPGRKKDGTWAAKKAERGKDRREAKAWERERAEYDRRFAREREDTDRRINEMRQQVESLRQTSGQGRQNDAYSSKMGEINTQIAAELKLLESDDKHDYTRYHQLQEQKIALIAQQQAAILFNNQRQQQPQDRYAGRRPIIASEFPWTDDPRYNDLSRKAFAYREYLINVEGKPDTLETDREALQTALAKFGGEFGLRQPAAPSQRTRSLWTAPGSRGAPERRQMPQEVDLGEVGRGTGLDQKTLSAVVRSAMEDEN